MWSSSSMARRIDVVYGGQLGNNMFQYAMGLRLANGTDAVISTVAPTKLEQNVKRWQRMGSPTKGSCVGNRAAVLTDRDGVSRSNVCAQVRSALQQQSCIRVDGFFQDFEAIGGSKSRDSLLSLFEPSLEECGDAAPDDGEVVLHIRTCVFSSDVPTRGWPACYGAMPWEYYEILLNQIIDRAAKLGKKKPSFTIVSPPTCANEPLLKKLSREFGAKRLEFPQSDELSDFCYMLKAKQLVLQPSTFGWWAAWLSSATEIHFPLMGLFAHRRTLNYPSGPRKTVPGGLKCDALFQGATKSLVVPEDRYVYHDVFGGRYFGAYKQRSDTFENWGYHGGFELGIEKERREFCDDPPRRVFKKENKRKPISLGPRSMELVCFAEKTEEFYSKQQQLDDAAVHHIKEQHCCNNKIRKSKKTTPILVFPRSHVEAALYYSSRSLERNVDFNFVGRINSKQPMVVKARRWVIDFARTFFTNQSHFVDTTARKQLSYKELDLAWDKSLSNARSFLPMDFMSRHEEHQCAMAKCDHAYYENLAKSRFTLAPAGDMPWSQRFFEAIMAGSVPIVVDSAHTGRSFAERNLGYKYLLASEFKARVEEFRAVNGPDTPLPYCTDWAKHNRDVFIRRQTVVKSAASLNTSLALCQSETFLDYV